MERFLFSLLILFTCQISAQPKVTVGFGAAFPILPDDNFQQKIGATFSSEIVVTKKISVGLKIDFVPYLQNFYDETKNSYNLPILAFGKYYLSNDFFRMFISTMAGVNFSKHTDFKRDYISDPVFTMYNVAKTSNETNLLLGLSTGFRYDMTEYWGLEVTGTYLVPINHFDYLNYYLKVYLNLL